MAGHISEFFVPGTQRWQCSGCDNLCAASLAKDLVKPPFIRCASRPPGLQMDWRKV